MVLRSNAIVVLGARVYTEIPRKQGKAVPEGNGPGPQHDELEPDHLTLADICRLFEERLERQLNRMKSNSDELPEKMRETRQRLAGLELDARQPCLATEADGPTDEKTH